MNHEPRTLNRQSVIGQRSSATLSKQAGVTYIGLLLAIVLIGVATAAIAPAWSTMVRRDKEAELLFRLGEFRRAITAYRRDHGRYPAKLEDLLEDKTQLQVRRYLRRIYPDPMTGKADWKLEFLVDKTGTVAGIKDLHSQSDAEGFRTIQGKGNRYSDW
ncbi:MAG: type II secretion system protein [Candidatus Methylomirabilales bacterium]